MCSKRSDLLGPYLEAGSVVLSCDCCPVKPPLARHGWDSASAQPSPALLTLWQQPAPTSPQGHFSCFPSTPSPHCLAVLTGGVRLLHHQRQISPNHSLLLSTSIYIHSPAAGCRATEQLTGGLPPGICAAHGREMSGVPDVPLRGEFWGF